MSDLYFRLSDSGTLADPVENTNSYAYAKDNWGENNVLPKTLDDLPDVPFDQFQTSLVNNEIVACPIKTAAAQQKEKSYTDELLRMTWWDYAKSAEGTVEIPTIKYLIDQGTNFDDYPPILKKVLNGIEPTDAEWQSYNPSFVIPE